MKSSPQLASGLITVTICLLLLVGYSLTSEGTASGEEPPTNLVVLPLFALGPATDSLLTLNNFGATSRMVTIRLLNRQGDLLAEKILRFDARETKRILVSALLTEIREAVGAIHVEHSGFAFEVGCQLQVLNTENRFSFDVVSNEAAQFSSRRLLSLVNQDESSANRIVLHNSSDSAQTVTFQVKSGTAEPKKTLTLLSHQTLIHELEARNQWGSVALVQVETPGESQGHLSGGVLWRHSKDGISGFTPLRDPALRTSSRLTTSHLHAANDPDYRQVLYLQNTTETERVVHGRLHIQRENGEAEQRSFEKVLPSFRGLRLELDDWLEGSGDDVSGASLDLEWDGPAAAILGMAYSIHRSWGTTIRNPLVDPARLSPRTSNYAVRVGAGYNTKVFIKNPSPESREVVLHLFASDGTEYDFGVVTVDPFATFQIDLGQIQQGQEEDKAGRILPEGPFTGQLVWFAFRGKYELVGRAMIIDPSGRYVESLSCVQCGIFVPDSFSLAALDSFRDLGDIIVTTGKIIFVDCGDGEARFETLGVQADSYTSSNPAVATVAFDGTVTAHRPGTSIIRGFIELEREICQLATCTVIFFTISRFVGSETVVVPEPTFKLIAVSFSDDHTIRKDEAGKVITAITDPVWEDTDNNAAPNKNEPVAYTRNKKLKVTARFAITSGALQEPVSGVVFSGDGPGQIDFSKSVTISGTEVTLTNMLSASALANKTNFFNPLNISWSVSFDGTNSTVIRTSAHKVYVTLADPVNPSTLYLTPLHLSLKTVGATSKSQVLTNVWSAFSGPANVKGWDGRSLFYYKPNQGFEACATTSVALLQSPTGSGQCGSFATLMLDALEAHGITEVNVTVVSADAGIGDIFLVKNWSFPSPTISGQGDFKWRLTLSEGGVGMVPPFVDNIYGNLTSNSGIPGQNTATPSEKAFGRHFILKTTVDASTRYWDPSYGTTYTGSSDFQSKSVAGYSKVIVLGGAPVRAARQPSGTTKVVFQDF